MAKPPTFAAARAELLAYLGVHGWDVKTWGLGVHGWDVKTWGPSGHLKTPHATSPSGRFRLWFRPQAVYYSAGGHHDANHSRSLWVDIRTTTPAEIVRITEAEERR